VIVNIGVGCIAALILVAMIAILCMVLGLWVGTEVVRFYNHCTINAGRC